MTSAPAASNGGPLSIKVLLLGLSVSLVIVTFGLTFGLSFWTYETSLSDQEQMYEDARVIADRASTEGMAASFDAGVSNSYGLVTQLMQKTTDEIASRMDAYLAIVPGTVETILHFLHLHPPCTNAAGDEREYCHWRDNNWLDGVLSPMIFSIFRRAVKFGVTEVMHINVYNGTIIAFLHNPITLSEESKETAGVPLDVPDLLMRVEEGPDTHRPDMTMRECLYDTNKPGWLNQEDWDSTGNRLGVGRDGEGHMWCIQDPTLFGGVPGVSDTKVPPRTFHQQNDSNCDVPRVKDTNCYRNEAMCGEKGSCIRGFRGATADVLTGWIDHPSLGGQTNVHVHLVESSPINEHRWRGWINFPDGTYWEVIKEDFSSPGAAAGNATVDVDDNYFIWAENNATQLRGYYTGQAFTGVITKGAASGTFEFTQGLHQADPWTNRPWVSIGPVGDDGLIRHGPCVNAIEQAKSGTPGLCPVPKSLAALDEVMMRAFAFDDMAAERRMSWSPVRNKGPMAAIQAYGALSSPDMYDCGGVYKKKLGLVTAGIDVTAFSNFMNSILEALAPGTVLYAVQQDPWMLSGPHLPGDGQYECKDDPHRLLEKIIDAEKSLPIAGATACSIGAGLLPGTGPNKCIDGDFRYVSSSVAQYTMLDRQCPVYCGTCPKSDADSQGILLGCAVKSSDSITPPEPGGCQAFAYKPVEESSLGGTWGVGDIFPINVRDCPHNVVRSSGRDILNTVTERGAGFKSYDPDGLHDWYYDPAQSGAVIQGERYWVDPSDPNHDPGVPGLRAPKRNKTIMAEVGPERHYYMKIREMKDRELGLMAWIVLLVLRDEAMKTIDEATRTVKWKVGNDSARVNAQITRDKQKTQDDKDTSVMGMIIGVIAACLIMMVVAVVFVFMIIKPLLQLQIDMAEVARMHLESVDLEAPRSKLDEVKNMQESFIQMVNNLIEYRNYMPQSILQDDEEEEEDEMVPGATTPGGSPMEERDGSKGDLGKSMLKGTKTKPSKLSNQSIMSSKGSDLQKTAMSMSHAAQKKQDQLKAEGLKKKVSSLIVANVRGWHEILHSYPEKGMENHSMVLQTLLQILQPRKGVPETFCGDRLCCSWNAVKNCAGHRAVCPAALLAMQKAGRELMDGGAAAAGAAGVQSQPSGAMTRHGSDLQRHGSSKKLVRSIDLGMAMVSGDVRCGNIGCIGMKKFTLFGSAVTWLYALERVGASLGASLVTDQLMWNETKNSFLYRLVEQADFKKHVKRKPIQVHELVSAKQVGEDEWMYQLEEGEKSDPYSKWNGFCKCVIDGESPAEEALMLLASARETNASSLPGEVIVQRFEKCCQGGAGIVFEPLQVKFH